jgi:16S rRNA (guanine966-N2)-methyltransferase
MPAVPRFRISVLPRVKFAQRAGRSSVVPLGVPLALSVMTRIIAGFAGSLTLAVPRSGTRPTSDRVREAIFSGLESRDAVAGSRVLDLYAGSGALGLEAASRGAASVTLVDNSKEAAAACRKNAAHILKSAPRGRAVAIDVSSSPAQSFVAAARQFWDIVFIDPPYELGRAEITHNLEALVPRLSPDAVIVLERSSRDAALTPPDGLTLDRRRDYGDTALYYFSLTEFSAADFSTTDFSTVE